MSHRNYDGVNRMYDPAGQMPAMRNGQAVMIGTKD